MQPKISSKTEVSSSPSKDSIADLTESVLPRIENLDNSPANAIKDNGFGENRSISIINIKEPTKENGLQTSDILAGLSLFVSLGSVLFALYAIFLTKKVEILYKKFESLCLNHVENIFRSLDSTFETNLHDLSANHRQNITSTFVDLNLLLVELKEIYPKIDFKQIEEISEEFSDDIYDNSTVTSTLNDFNVKYFSTKTKILNNLYEYALYKELNYFSNFFKRAKK